MSDRPVPLHREKHPDLDVEGCFGCKAANIHFAPVPGGARSKHIDHGRNVEKGLNRYRELREAGEQPSGTSLEAQAKDKRKKMLWEKHEKNIVNENPKETVDSVKKSLLNT